MKKIILIFSILLVTSFNLNSQGNCNGVTCPDGWLLLETGWVTVKIGHDPIGDTAIYCTVKFCYCYSPPISPGDDTPNFFLKKMIFDDISCMGKIDAKIINESFMKVVIALHSNDLPPKPCPVTHHTADLYTAKCFIETVIDGSPCCVPCDGDGYCSRAYLYCMNYNTNPPTVEIIQMFPPSSFGGDDCYLPQLASPVDYHLSDCIWWCYY
jgi:hypothetical protein